MKNKSNLKQMASAIHRLVSSRDVRCHCDGIASENVSIQIEGQYKYNNGEETLNGTVPERIQANSKTPLYISGEIRNNTNSNLKDLRLSFGSSHIVSFGYVPAGGGMSATHWLAYPAETRSCPRFSYCNHYGKVMYIEFPKPVWINGRPSSGTIDFHFTGST